MWLRRLSKSECQLLDDVLDLHCVGLREAKEATFEDPTVNKNEALLESMGMIDDELRRLDIIRQKLRR